jgi:hypothetical protein
MQINVQKYPSFVRIIFLHNVKQYSEYAKHVFIFPPDNNNQCNNWKVFEI